MSTWNGDPSHYLNNTLIAESSFISTNYTATAIPPNYVSISGGYAPPSASGNINIVAGAGISASKINDKTYHVSLDRTELDALQQKIEMFHRKFEELRGMVFMSELKASNSYHNICYSLGLDPNNFAEKLNPEKKKDKPRPPDNDDDIMQAQRAEINSCLDETPNAVEELPGGLPSQVLTSTGDGCMFKNEHIPQHVLDFADMIAGTKKVPSTGYQGSVLQDSAMVFAPFLPLEDHDESYDRAMKILDV